MRGEQLGGTTLDSVSEGHEASGVHSRWGSRGSTVSGVMYFTFDLMHNIHSFRGIEIWTRRGLIDHTLPCKADVK